MSGGTSGHNVKSVPPGPSAAREATSRKAREMAYPAARLIEGQHPRCWDNIRSILLGMRFGIRGRDREHPSKVPRLVPTASFDKVLLIGGKNLSSFQSLCLVITGVCVGLGIGVPIILNERYLQSQLGRFGYHGSPSVVVGSLFILWGGVMIFNGLVGFARRIWKRNQG